MLEIRRQIFLVPHRVAVAVRPILLSLAPYYEFSPYDRQGLMRVSFLDFSWAGWEGDYSTA